MNCWVRAGQWEQNRLPVVWPKLTGIREGTHRDVASCGRLSDTASGGGGTAWRREHIPAERVAPRRVGDVGRVLTGEARALSGARQNWRTPDTPNELTSKNRPSKQASQRG